MSVLNFSNSVESNNMPDNGEKSMKHAVSADDPQFTITFNYELLDDSYCLLKEGNTVHLYECVPPPKSAT